ncbi:hypothetical protein PROFUN_10744 [Planoprotostelium fungivorum]|uniref:Uncharacterized protein n=1 Tax=Planoprotostelium fungivorum TaxID=1890364 RepID=A0A2P6N7Z1_9EUKA|nr:hypothetical protein PROFUN_10744 [Planoprotostelium fungivorum]
MSVNPCGTAEARYKNLAWAMRALQIETKEEPMNIDIGTKRRTKKPQSQPRRTSMHSSGLSPAATEDEKTRRSRMKDVCGSLWYS